MSVTQWKLLTQLKEYCNKYTIDKNMYQTMNKEFTRLLQKVQPSVYGDHLIRRVETKAVDTVRKETDVAEKEQTSSSYMPNILTGWQLKLGKSEVAEKKPKWLAKKTTVSKTAIMAQMNHIITSIIQAETDTTKIKRIEDLSQHLLVFPEAKHQAVKHGAIRLLLRMQETNKNPEVAATIRESFAILGHSGPLPMKGIRVLAIDGGGTRGLLVIEMLKKFEELTGKRIHELFDLVCGVSTGAIISCAIGKYRKVLLSN